VGITADLKSTIFDKLEKMNISLKTKKNIK